MGRLCAHVPGTEEHGLVREAEALQDVLGVAGQRGFEFIVARFRAGEFYQLDFLELVLADNSAYVAAVRAGFAAEAGRVGAVFQRQFVEIEGLIAMPGLVTGTSAVGTR